MHTAEPAAGRPYRARDGALSLQVKAIPNAGRSEVVGVRAGELVVKLQVPALEGRANRELLRLLARRLGIARSSVVLISGRSSQHKRLRLPAAAEGVLDELCRPAD